jgi:hypothetical protein
MTICSLVEINILSIWASRIDVPCGAGSSPKLARLLYLFIEILLVIQIRVRLYFSITNYVHGVFTRTACLRVASLKKLFSKCACGNIYIFPKRRVYLRIACIRYVNNSTDIIERGLNAMHTCFSSTRIYTTSSSPRILT